MKNTFVATRPDPVAVAAEQLHRDALRRRRFLRRRHVCGGGRRGDEEGGEGEANHGGVPGE